MPISRDELGRFAADAAEHDKAEKVFKSSKGKEKVGADIDKHSIRQKVENAASSAYYNVDNAASHTEAAKVHREASAFFEHVGDHENAKELREKAEKHERVAESIRGTDKEVLPFGQGGMDEHLASLGGPAKILWNYKTEELGFV